MTDGNPQLLCSDSSVEISEISSPFLYFLKFDLKLSPSGLVDYTAFSLSFIGQYDAVT